MQKLIISALIAAATLTVISTSAQPGMNSPYSRFGLGELTNPNYIAIQHMGSIGAAYHDSYHSNFVNPAAIGYLRSTSFETGIFGQYNQWSENSSGQEFDEWRGNLTYLSLAFPLSNPVNELLDARSPENFWSMGFSLRPYSSMGYEVRTRRIDPDIGQVDDIYIGDGNTYQLIWTTAFRHRNLSLGVNLGYHFGKLNINTGTAPRNLDYSYSASTSTDFSVNSFIWRLGAQYTYYLDPEAEVTISGLRKSPSINVGLYYNAAHSFNTKSNFIQTRINTQYNNAIDTFTVLELDTKSEGTLPAEFGIGFMYDDNKHWKIGLDFAHSGWSNYENNVRTKQGEILKNSSQISAGMEYTPDPQSYNNYFNRVRYRAGLLIGTDPRTIGTQGQEQLSRTALTVGLGLPVLLRQDLSFINFGVELGRFGNDQFLESQYARLSLGFTLTDNGWFYQRKFK